MFGGFLALGCSYVTGMSNKFSFTFSYCGTVLGRDDVIQQEKKNENINNHNLYCSSGKSGSV